MKTNVLIVNRGSVVNNASTISRSVEERIVEPLTYLKKINENIEFETNA